MDQPNETVSSYKEESIEQLSKYIHMIMPLMFETWMEMRPASNNSITQESAVMLKVIMDIQIELLSMISKNDVLKQQFLKKYQDNYDKLLMSNFPYVQNTEGGKRGQESGGEKCIYQNLCIAIIYHLFSLRNHSRFSKYRGKCFDFIEEAIMQWKPKDAEFNSHMKQFIRALFTRESLKIFSSDAKRILSALVRKCNVDQTTYDPKLELVCEIFEKADDSRQNDTDNLLSQMIHILAEKEIVPVYLIETVSSLAKKGNKSIVEALDKNAIKIIDNLQGKLRITGCLNPDDSIKYKFQIANLVYWVNSREVLLKLGESTASKIDSISVKINQIVNLKLN